MSAHARVLPPLQKRIVLCLARVGPLTINGTVQHISGHYKPTWIAFHSLEAKGIVQKLGLKSYRGRNYPEYWLANTGIAYALLAGADSGSLLKVTKESTNKKDMVSYAEVMCSLPKFVFERHLRSSFIDGTLMDFSQILYFEYAGMSPGERTMLYAEIKKNPAATRMAIDFIEAIVKEYEAIKKRLDS